MDAVKRINVLFPKYLDRKITEMEWEELLVWMSVLNEDELTALSHSQKYLWEKAKAGEWPSTADKVNWDKILENVLYSGDATIAPTAHRVHFLKTAWFRYAAAVVLMLGAGSYLWFINRNSDADTANDNKHLQADIAPGTNKAMLTIGNNKPIDLSNDKTGIAVSNTIKYNDGEKIADAGQMLQLTTPPGGQYQAVLPDGSKVWLNAASSIRFPSKFNGSQREVEITGEAYLEVTKNAKQPFYVHATKETVEVLGTSFNVNAYEDEDEEKITLIDGSVRIKSVITNLQSPILKPGQEAVINNEAVKVQTVNTDNTIAWVKGYFYFDKADPKAILRQISRWYDLEIVYMGEVPQDLFSGKIERNIPLSGILRLLEQANIKTRLEGKKLVVL